MQDDTGVPSPATHTHQSLRHPGSVRGADASPQRGIVPTVGQAYVVPTGRSDLADAIDLAVAGSSDAVTLRSGIPLSGRSLVESVYGDWHLSLKRLPSNEKLGRLQRRLLADRVKVLHIRAEDIHRHLDREAIIHSRGVLDRFVFGCDLHLLILSGPERFIAAMHRPTHGEYQLDVITPKTAAGFRRSVASRIEATRRRSGRRS